MANKTIGQVQIGVQEDHNYDEANVLTSLIFPRMKNLYLNQNTNMLM
jgi:hypothetical protein